MALADLFGWGVVSVIAVLLIGIGYNVVGWNPPAYLAAKVLFTIAALLLIGRSAVSLVAASGKPFDRFVVTVFVFGFIGLGWEESWRWVTARETEAKQREEILRREHERQTSPAAPVEQPKAPQPNAPPVKPLASIAKIQMSWFDGETPVIEVVNLSDGPIECRARGQILKAKTTHKRRDSYRAAWRHHYHSGEWIRFEQRGEKQQILVASHSTSGWGDRAEVISISMGETDGEAWMVKDFKFADVFFEIETKPPTEKPFNDWNRLWWNRREGVFELGKPIEDDDED